MCMHAHVYACADVCMCMHACMCARGHRHAAEAGSPCARRVVLSSTLTSTLTLSVRDPHPHPLPTHTPGPPPLGPTGCLAIVVECCRRPPLSSPSRLMIHVYIVYMHACIYMAVMADSLDDDALNPVGQRPYIHVYTHTHFALGAAHTYTYPLTWGNPCGTDMLMEARAAEIAAEISAGHLSRDRAAVPSSKAGRGATARQRVA